MTITDVNGYKLYLTKTQLIEHEAEEWFLNLVDIPDRIHPTSEVEIHQRKYPTSLGMRVRINAITEAMQESYLHYEIDKKRSFFRIGCHHFSTKTFAKILKAAKEAKRAVTKR
jgi:hypothetical protein